MERVDTMDNKYGITSVPPIAKVVKNESKYWGDMVTLFDSVGRGSNTSVILRQGDVYHIEPGLMHMRIALEDTVIIELSTTDDDSDSHIVEDGKTYKFVEN